MAIGSSVPVAASARSTARKRVLAAIVALASAGAAMPAAADAWPRRVDATYRISFNGFDIGRFAFATTVEGASYTAEGDARLSALLGAFKWQGMTRTAGTIQGQVARPLGYTFDFEGVGKQGSVKLGFNQGNVASISILPPKPPLPGTVPLRDTHLAGALDPLTAVLTMSRTANANPCGRRLPVFDGKQRFDLVLTYARQERVAETRPSGQPGVAYVCRVKYVPIAGHAMNEETRLMASSSGIEVALRPVPSAGIFVPYQITIPTGAGTAILTSEQVNIVTGAEQIALSH